MHAISEAALDTPVWALPSAPDAPDCAARIATAAGDMLARGDGRLVPMRYFLVAVCEAMTEDLRGDRQVEVVAPCLGLPPARAAALGTVALEAVMRSLLWSPAGETPGRIDVRLDATADGRLELTVIDGIATGSLGMACVDWARLQACVSVLNASLTIMKTPGQGCILRLNCDI